MKYRKSVLCLFILLSLLFSVFGLVNSSGKTNQLYYEWFSSIATDSYFDSFDTTTYEDPSTTAWGWGKGTLSNNRDFESYLLDFYPTNYPVKDLAVQGRKAYLACSNPSDASETLHVVNLTNIYNMKTVGMRNAAPDMLSIDLNGDTLLTGIAGLSERINSYNVTFPGNLDASTGIFFGSFGLDGLVTDIQIDGHLAFAAVNSSVSSRSLRIIDCTDPDNLFEIANNWASTTTYGLYIHGGLGYLAESNRGFYLVNLTSRATIAEIGHVDTAGVAMDVVADGNYAYVADHENGVVIIDTSTLDNPVIVGHYGTPGSAWKLAKIGTTLFVADGNGGVQVLDVANPNNPILVTTIVLTSYVFDIELYGGDLLIGAADGLYAYRIGGGMVNFATGLYYLSYYGYEYWDVRVWGSTAYIAGGPDGFYTLDISEPLNPILLDHYIPSIFRNFKKLDVDGTIAYLVDTDAIYVFDVADPTNIYLVNIIYGSGMVDVYADGELIYATTNTGFGIVNMTLPYSPQLIIDYGISFGSYTAIWVQGPNLHLVKYPGGDGVSIYVYDISDMTNPILTDTVIQPGYFWDVYVDGDMAYYGCEDQMYVYNVSNPTQVSQYGYTSLNSMGVWGFGPYIISADSTDGISLINNTNPNEQIVTSQYIQTVDALQVTCHGDRTFVANGDSLIILHHFKYAARSFDSDQDYAYSLEVDSVDYPILDATLVADDNALAGIIYYSMSADGGVHWESVTPGVKHYFSDVGNDLRWMAEIRGHIYRSSYLYEINIDYTYNDTAITSTPTPTPTPTDTPTSSYSFIGGYVSVSLAITTSFAVITLVRRRKKYSK